jgi:hypothetical protein
VTRARYASAMNELDGYLRRHFVTAETLASASGITAARLHAFVEDGIAPRPSYTVTHDDRLISQAFGETPASGAQPGEYFRLATAPWVRGAARAAKLSGIAAARRDLERQFRANFATALAEFDETLFRLPDSFSEQGARNEEGLSARTRSAWESFTTGVFSLCVADPSSERSIARKEVLQEALTALSQNGSRSVFSAEERARLGRLIADYSRAAMPFAPPEYARSSRKRLVDDLEAKLVAPASD